jgi:hypothetical protein
VFLAEDVTYVNSCCGLQLEGTLPLKVEMVKVPRRILHTINLTFDCPSAASSVFGALPFLSTDFAVDVEPFFAMQNAGGIAGLSRDTPLSEARTRLTDH